MNLLQFRVEETGEFVLSRTSVTEIAVALASTQTCYYGQRLCRAKLVRRKDALDATAQDIENTPKHGTYCDSDEKWQVVSTAWQSGKDCDLCSGVRKWLVVVNS